ncbi:unnamed protein product [Ectocarpus sp. CCAP 1310/34]|nr:unnamed protein product [Ectocarpus sp. CCAP 1310/34]
MDDELMDSMGGGGGGSKRQHQGTKYHRTLQSDGTYLTLRHAFGVEGGIRDNVAFVTVPDPDAEGAGLMLGYLLHPVGQQVAMHRVDDGSMKFLVSRQRNVREILALCVSPNKRVIAVCEKGRAPEEDPGSAQVSVYLVANGKRIRTMLFPGRGDFITCCFSGDSKWLVTAATEPESNIVVWNWEKEKVRNNFIRTMFGPKTGVECAGHCRFHPHGMHTRMLLVDKTAQNSGSSATRVAFHPGDHGFFTTSGAQHLRLWYTSSDNVLKAHAILPQAKEQASNRRQPTRMVAITDGDDHGASSGGGGGGMNQRGSLILVFDASTASPFLELKQTLHAQLPHTARLETLIPFSKGFIVAGGGINGYLGVYENMEDHRDPYMWIKSFTANGSALESLTLNRGSEVMYVYSRTNEILTFNLGNMDVLDEGSNHFHPLLQGGNHTSPVVALDVCLTKPIVVTVGGDRVLRVWSYLKWKCEVVYEFRNEDPNCASLHPTGFQVAVGFKDRVRIYSLLMEGLRVLRDIPQKNCRAVAYANGGHLLAVASGFSLMVYTSITAQQVLGRSLLVAFCRSGWSVLILSVLGAQW